MRKNVFSLLLFITIFMNNVFGQVTIGSGSPPLPGALLQLKVIDDAASNGDINTSKGLGLPRVKLPSANNLYPMFLSDPDDTTSGPNAEYSADKNSIDLVHRGLIVYNIGGNNALTEGVYTWNGFEWVRFSSGTGQSPEISALDCANSRIVPSRYQKDAPYEGVLIVPYSGGNGGYYSGGISIDSYGVTGLTATLQPGNLAYGNGELVFTLSGTPSDSSPEAAGFDIDFLDRQCTATITGEIIGIGEFVTGTFVLTKAQVDAYAGGENTSGNGRLLSHIYPDRMPILDGLMMDLEVINTAYYRPIIVNVSSREQLISLQTFASQVNENKTILNATLTPAPTPIPETGRGSLITTSGNSTSVPAKYMISADNNNIVYWTSSDAEVITTNVQVQINATTYRWYEFTWWSMQIGPNSSNYEKKIFFSVQRKA